MSKALFPKTGAALQRAAEIPAIERFALGRQGGSFVVGLSLLLASFTVGGGLSLVGLADYRLALFGVMAGAAWMALSVVFHLIDRWVSAEPPQAMR